MLLSSDPAWRHPMVPGAGIEAALSGAMIYHARDHSNAQACNGAPPRWPGRRHPHLRSLNTPSLSLLNPLVQGAAEAKSQATEGTPKSAQGETGKVPRSRRPRPPSTYGDYLAAVARRRDASVSNPDDL